MTIRDALYFSYAGIKSTEYDIYNINLNSGMMEEFFTSQKEIKEVKIQGRDKPYFQNIERQPLEFNVSFGFYDSWDEKKLREVGRWLTEQKYYQELYFSYGENENPERIFYALQVGDSSLIHNGLKQGYVNLTFRCDGAYAYSPYKMNKTYNWTYENIDKNITTFNSSTFYNTKKINDAVSLTLNQPTWEDYPESLTWLDDDR